MKTCVIIPARFNSSRFPGKPLVKLNGKEMILWVSEICAKAVNISNVFIATDDKRISDLVIKNGYQSIMTSSDLLTGTDRVAEAAKLLDYDIYVNVQGDEPLLEPKDILKAIELKKKYPEFVINSYCSLAANEDPNNLNIPKVVITDNSELIYISRAVIPKSKKSNFELIFKKQVCIYSYNKNDLLKFLDYGKKSKVEKIEDIEILRFFELNIKIKMFEASKSSLAIDIPEDVAKVENELKFRNSH
jgi:3-deoxy-manno-octulosonate cytidylyltransferase (CMP-KDO synthetase)